MEIPREVIGSHNPKWLSSPEEVAAMKIASKLRSEFIDKYLDSKGLFDSLPDRAEVSVDSILGIEQRINSEDTKTEISGDQSKESD